MALKADTNVGFYGTVPADVWARIAGTGARYAVRTPGALVASPGTGDRTVNLTPGPAWGDGVESIWNTPAEGLAAPAVPAVSAGSRWDTIAIRRTWTPDGTPENPTETGRAELVLIPGSPTRAVASDREQTPGAVADQPLWLARFDYGKTAVQDFADLRVFAGVGGGLVANDVAALDYLTDVGTTVTIGKTTWRRTVGAAGNPVWVPAAGGPLNVVSGTWHSLAASGRLGASVRVWPSNWTLATATISDPGIPYRLRVYASGEMGSEVDGTRWEFFAYANGNTWLGWHIVMGPEPQTIKFREIHGVLSQTVFTGPSTVTLRAERRGGSGYGGRTEFNKNLTVEVWAA